LGAWSSQARGNLISRGKLMERSMLMRGKRRRLAALTSLFVSVVSVLVIGSAAAASDGPEKFISFDEAKGELPEGLAIDKVGNMFVSIAPLAQLWRIPPRSTEPALFGSVQGFTPGEGFGLLGLAIDAPGNVYAAMSSLNPEANGVWRFDRKTGAETRLPGTEQIVIPNGLAFDKRGNLYITDSRLGAIWRVSPGGTAELWLQHELLEGDGSLGIFVGANGIAYRQGSLLVTNTEKFNLLQIKVLRDGSPGEPRVLVGFEPAAPDGLALDVHGNAWVALISASTIAMVTPGGGVEVIASGDPLDWPSSLAFGTGKGQRKTLFVVNFSIGEMFGAPPGSGPGVLRMNAGVPGMPLP
jgi:sugar lactone lactonase YvrE